MEWHLFPPSLSQSMETMSQPAKWRDVSLGATTVVSVILTITILLFSWIVSPSRKGGIRELGGLSILTAWPFFSKRYDFLRSNFQKTGESIFMFKVLQHSVVAVRGSEARKAFFDDKSLSLNEGYKILMGAAPRLSDISVQSELQENVGALNKQLLIVFHKDRLADILPTLFDDVSNQMLRWGKEGRIDPFKNVYDLVFQTTVRMATCRELSNDIDAVKRLQSLYWTIEKSSTPTSLLLPWFPSRASKAKAKATQELYVMIYGYVGQRKAAKVPTSDAIDVLLSRGVSVDETIGFVLGVVFAGVINTGATACWVLFFLASNPEWKNKVIAELKTLIARNTNTISSDSLHQRLSAIPVSAWEDEMPVMESVIRETIRIVFNGAALRRNLLDDIQLGDKTLSKGSFLTYQIADAHLNPDIYTNPPKFDPDRFAEGREEDKKAPLAYLGWGAGRHPCTGVRVAKLELKIIISLFAIGYEFDAVDESGNFPNPFPRPNHNDIQQIRPVGGPCYLKFKRVVD